MGARQHQTETILLRVREGDLAARGELFVLAHKTLRDIAGHERRRWKGNLTINATAMVNEAYLKLMDGQALSVNDRAHFLSVAGKAMRQVLQDYGKGRVALKRGAGAARISIDTAERLGEAPFFRPELGNMDFSRALDRLGLEYPELARLVECRFLAGMTLAETAVALEIGTTTVKRRWSLAKVLLYDFFTDLQ